ncbi:MAG: hypothetical protein HY819_11380 [Acidobacteria bacterium]|nr:hypothetical protein [Acidobacteriota bacterium]
MKIILWVMIFATLLVSCKMQEISPTNNTINLAQNQTITNEKIDLKDMVRRSECGESSMVEVDNENTSF